MSDEVDTPESAGEISYRPNLPDWGCYPSWPGKDEEWIFVDDRPVAKRLIPSRRVFRRERWDGSYYWLYYGPRSVRVQPTMWVRCPSCDLEVGEQVELLQMSGENDAGIYRIREITLSKTGDACEFWLRRGEMPIEKSFPRTHLRPLKQKYQLKLGFFEHATPTASLPEDCEMLDVGNLLGNDS